MKVDTSSLVLECGSQYQAGETVKDEETLFMSRNQLDDGLS